MIPITQCDYLTCIGYNIHIDTKKGEVNNCCQQIWIHSNNFKTECYLDTNNIQSYKLKNYIDNKLTKNNYFCVAYSWEAFAI